jgi:hypothetical protein
MKRRAISGRPCHGLGVLSGDEVVHIDRAVSGDDPRARGGRGRGSGIAVARAGFPDAVTQGPANMPATS